MNILSLFDGISCCRESFKQCNIKVDNYFASEIEESSMKIAMKNHPDIIQLGDVTNVTKTSLPKINLLAAGSPCQGFSNLGKRTNFEHDESKLFFEFVRLLEELKPDYFFLENVRLKAEWRDIITSYVKVKPRLIDSKYYSAQRRSRYYWTNIPFMNLVCDNNLYIKDIVNEEIDKSSSFIKGSSYEFVTKHNLKEVAVLVKTVYNFDISNRKDILYKNLIPLQSKAPCIVTVNSPIVWGGQYYYINGRFRLPTLIELERLQTLPDNYTECEGIKKHERIAAIGNCWTVNTINQFFSFFR